MTLPPTVFLDLDDTILDDSSNVQSGWLAALSEHADRLGGLEAPVVFETLEAVRTWYWADAERHRTGRADLIAAGAWIVAEALRRLQLDADEVLARSIAARYRDLRDAGMSLLPGAIEAVEAMRSAGSRLALLTNGGALGQRAKLKRFGLAPYFDFVCIEGEFGCGKPDERVYRAALGALGAEPATTWMVGDNLEWDVAAPMRLGITGIWLDRLGTGLPPGVEVTPSHIVLALSELV